MLLLTGPPGAGKTHRILEQVRAALGRGSSDVRLLVPTATMAEHLRNQLAREGLPVRPGLIQTLSRFIAPYVQDYPEASAASLELLVDRALASDPPAVFSAVARLPGFRSAVARLIDELSSTGCDARRLSRLLDAVTPQATLAAAFLPVYEAVEKLLLRRGWALRANRLRCAADEIRTRGLPSIHKVWFDGFFTFSDPELNLVDAVRSQADVEIALPSWCGAEPARDALLGSGFCEERLTASARRQPRTAILAAPGIDREVEEVARRILAQAAAGRPFREIGIILRSREPYVPVLRTVLERFGIPARFYFAEPLIDHAAVRLFAAGVEAMRSGWDHAQVLDCLRLAASGFGGTPACDRFDILVRERLPGRGLEDLRQLSESPRLRALVDRLAGLESWRAQRALPREWAARARSLRWLYQPPRIADEASHQTAALWRSYAAALAGFEAAIEEAAAALPPQDPLPFSEFWQAAELTLRQTQLRSPDHRRNVVHVMDVYEARQWELPVVFVCGLLEKQFPRYHAPDPILSDAGRASLQHAGVRVYTTADRQREEEFLFEIAASRATAELVLSYPEANAKGDPNLPAFFLERFAGAPREPARPPLLPGSAPPSEPRPAYLRDPVLIEIVRRRHERLSPTAIEDYLQCPFQFFFRHTLELTEPPPAPGDRLGAALEGKIVHQALAELERSEDTLDTVFARVFEEVCRSQRVLDSCRTELARLKMLRDLRRCLAAMRRLPGWTTHIEQPVRFALDGDVAITGRIDRFDLSGDGRAVVFDFKYSGAEGIRKRIRWYGEGKAVQGALYLLGLAERFGYFPAGFFYWGLRGEVALDGWHTPLPGFETTGTACTAEELRERLARARMIAIDAAAEIRRGRVEAAPEDRERCQYCAYLDACRQAVEAAEAMAGAAP